MNYTHNCIYYQGVLSGYNPVIFTPKEWIYEDCSSRQKPLVITIQTNEQKLYYISAHSLFRYRVVSCIGGLSPISFKYSP